MMVYTPAHSFDEMKRWLDSIEGQTVGIPTAVCQTGEHYVEFFENGLARPSDTKVIEANVARAMQTRLAKYFEDRRGMIYWRIPFETVIEPTAVVVRYDEAGPDHDFMTDRRCVMDKDWVAVKAYCRLYRAHCGFAGFDFIVKPTPAKEIPTQDAA